MIIRGYIFVFSRDEVIEYCQHNKMDQRIEDPTGVSTCDCIYGTADHYHVNMKSLKEYKLDGFTTSSDIKVIHFSQS